MRPTVQYAILFVIIWFLGKMTFFYTQTFQRPHEVKFLVLWNMLCLLLGITIGSYAQKRREINSETTALYDMKNSIAGGLVYSVLVGILIYVYYAKIDPAYNERQLHTAEIAIKEALEDPVQLKKIRQNPEMGTMTKEELYNKALTGQKAIYSPGSTMTVSMLGMLLLSTLNSLVVTVVYRRIVFKRD